MFRFSHKEFLLLYSLIPAFIILFFFMIGWKKKAIKKFGSHSIVKRLFPDVSVTKPIIRFFLLFLAFVFLIFGICGPQIGTKQEEIKREGVDVVIALEVSNSMNAEDIKNALYILYGSG